MFQAFRVAFMGTRLWVWLGGRSHLPAGGGDVRPALCSGGRLESTGLQDVAKLQTQGFKSATLWCEQSDVPGAPPVWWARHSLRKFALLWADVRGYCAVT